ncbi:MAG: tRNA dihydrouridine synthase DusB [Clostridia bacterium]|nr:tRNA dihydrouridine synthase DusB [Clostridia bacterium]
MKIGSLKLSGNIFLAPMAGVTDLPFRLLCKEQGASLVYTEMISAKAMHYNDEETMSLSETRPEEEPVAAQIFGSEPEIMAEAAQRLSHRKDISLIDINMGCPAPKIVKNGEGSALMKKPELVRRIVREVVRSSAKPVTVKIRKGWDDTTVNAVEIAQICEEEGASAVTVHGRTREQYYSGHADLAIIKEVKKALRIPVIGNGDIKKPEDARIMFDVTGCDAVMIGRGAQGNPWIFSNVNAHLGNGHYSVSINKENLYNTIKRHYDLMEEIKGEHKASLEMRKHIGWYLHGLPESAKVRSLIFQTKGKKDAIKILASYLCQSPECR